MIKTQRGKKGTPPRLRRFRKGELLKPMDTTTTDSKEKLIKIIKRLLHTDEDLDFLLSLEKEDLEKLASVVRAVQLQ